jgi:hypothetical protein
VGGRTSTPRYICHSKLYRGAIAADMDYIHCAMGEGWRKRLELSLSRKNSPLWRWWQQTVARLVSGSPL